MERNQWKVVATGSAVAGMAITALMVSTADGDPLPEVIRLQSASQQDLIAGPASVGPDATQPAGDRSGASASVSSVAGPPRAGGDMLTREYTTTSIVSAGSIASPDGIQSQASAATTASPDATDSQASVTSIDSPSVPAAPAPAPVAPAPAPAPVAPAPAPAPAQPDSPDSVASPASIDS